MSTLFRVIPRLTYIFKDEYFIRVGQIEYQSQTWDSGIKEIPRNKRSKKITII